MVLCSLVLRNLPGMVTFVLRNFCSGGCDLITVVTSASVDLFLAWRTPHHLQVASIGALKLRSNGFLYIHSISKEAGGCDGVDISALRVAFGVNVGSW